MCEVARGDKHYLRKSADCKAQMSEAFVPLTELIYALKIAICIFSRVVFITSNNLTNKSLFMIQYLGVITQRCHHLLTSSN